MNAYDKWQVKATFPELQPVTLASPGLTSNGLVPVGIIGPDGTRVDTTRPSVAVPDDSGRALDTIAISYGYLRASDQFRPVDEFDMSDASIDDSDQQNALATFSFAFAFSPAASAFLRQNQADTFKNVVASASGESIVWTPGAGKKFVLMGYTISVCGTLAALAPLRIDLLDGTGGTIIRTHFAAVNDTVSGDTQIGMDLNQGIISGLADRVLKVKLSAAMTAGGVAVNTFGTEI